MSAPNLPPDHAPSPAIIPEPISPVRAYVARPIPPTNNGVGIPIAVPATPRTVGKIASKNPASGRPVLGLVDRGLPILSIDNLLRALSSLGVMWTSCVSFPRPCDSRCLAARARLIISP